MLFSELGETLDALANEKNLSKDSVSEKYVLEDCDEKMLEIMSNYEYDYKKIAQDILKGKIDFPVNYINNGYYEKLYNKLCRTAINKHNDNSEFSYGSESLVRTLTTVSDNTNKLKKIKYEKGILMMGDLEIKDVNDISQIFDKLVECLTKHGEYLKRYLQKKAELEEKLGFLNEEDTNVDENKTNDLF